MAGDVTPLRFRRQERRATMDKGLPHDWEAEHELCRWVMDRSGDGFDDLARLVRPEHFTRWAPLWQALSDVVGADQPCDITSMLTYIAALPMREGAHPFEHLGGASCVLSGNGRYILDQDEARRIARRLRDLAARREAILTAKGLIEMASASDVDLGTLAKAWDQGGEVLRTSTTNAREWVHVGDIAQDIAEHARERAEGGRGSTFTTGIDRLDEMLGGGLVAGDLVIVGGRPAMGKSAFALSLMLKSARRGVGHGLFSLELMNSIAVRRLLAQQARISGQAIKQGRDEQGRPLSAADYRQILGAVDDLRQMRIMVNDRPGQSLAAVRSSIRRLRGMMPELGIVTLDYLQIMQFGGGKSDSQHNRIAETAQGLRGLAKEEGIAVIVLSQLSREVDKREGQRPQNSDLRDSGGIEAAATHIWFPYRHSVRAPENPDPEFQRKAELIVTKQTDGPCGSIPMVWHPEYQEFAAEEARYEERHDWPPPSSRVLRYNGGRRDRTGNDE